MAAASEQVCPPPQTRTRISISQILHIAQAQEHARRAKEVVVQVKTELEPFHAPLNWAARVAGPPLATPLSVACQQWKPHVEASPVSELQQRKIFLRLERPVCFSFQLAFSSPPLCGTTILFLHVQTALAMDCRFLN